MLIQCTAALQAKIKKHVEITDLEAIQAQNENAGNINDFFAWHANIHPFDQNHSQYTDANKIPGFKAIRNSVLLTNNVSHAPAVIIAARAATYKGFVNEVKKAVRTTLLVYGATEEFVERYLAQPVIFTKSGNRKQLGLHKELAQSLQWAAADYVDECHGEIEPLPAVMANHMKDFLLGAPNYHMPGEATEKKLKALGGWKDGADEWSMRLARKRAKSAGQD